jgi:hypothetical protein
MDEEKPGGIFTKKLYAEENTGLDHTESSRDKDSDEESENSDGKIKKNGGIDSRTNGFCRTENKYRAHYKIARIKQAKIAEDKSLM